MCDKKNQYFLSSICSFFSRRRRTALKPRVAQRRMSTVAGLYKVLDRDKFYARHYDGIKSPMTLIDISATGCAFRVDQPVAKGAYLEVTLDKLSNAYTFNTPIIIACETVYCHFFKDFGNRIGVKFLEIDWKDVKSIQRFTESSR